MAVSGFIEIPKQPVSSLRSQLVVLSVRCKDICPSLHFTPYTLHCCYYPET